MRTKSANAVRRGASLLTWLVLTLAVGRPLGAQGYPASEIQSGHLARTPEMRDIGVAGGEDALAFALDGRLLAGGNGLYAGSMEGIHSLWASLSDLRTLEDEREVAAMAFSPDGALLAASLRNRFNRPGGVSIDLFAVHEGVWRRTLAHSEAGAVALAFSPDGRIVAGTTAAPHPAVVLWDTVRGTVLRTLPATGEAAGTALAFSPDGRFLASGGRGIAIWDLQMSGAGRLLRTMTPVHTLAFSPDGSALASGGEDGAVRLWNARDSRPGRVLAGPAGTVAAVRFSPDGSTVAAGGWNDRTVRLWDIRTGTGLGGAVGPSRIRTLAFSPDGQSLAAGGEGGATVVWIAAALRTPDGRIPGPLPLGNPPLRLRRTPWAAGGGFGLERWRLPSPRRRGSRFVQIATSESESDEFDSTYPFYVSVWDAVTGLSLGRVTLHQPYTLTQVAAISVDGRTLALGEQADVLLIDLGSGRKQRALHLAEPDAVTALDFAPDGRSLAAGYGKGGVCLWNPADGKLLRRLPASGEDLAEVRDVVFAPDGTQLAVVRNPVTADRKLLSIRPTMMLWDLRTGGGPRFLDGRGQEPAFSPDGRLLAARSDAGIGVWDVMTGHRRRTLRTDYVSDYGETGTVAVGFAPNSDLLELYGTAGLDAVWDTGSLRQPPMETPLVRLAAPAPAPEESPNDSPPYFLSSVAFSPDGAALAVSAVDGVRIWGTAAGHRLRRTVPGSGPIVFGPGGRQIGDVIGGAGGSLDLRLWAFGATGPASFRALAHRAAGWWRGTLAWSPDGAVAAVSREIHQGRYVLRTDVDVRDTRTGQIVAILSSAPLGQAADSPLSVLAISSDHRRAAGAFENGEVALWDVSSGGLRQLAPGFQTSVQAFAFSPDNQTLVTGDQHGFLQTWDAATGKLRRTWAAHTGAITALTFSPSGRTMASASEDQTVRLWDPGTAQAKQVFEGHSDTVTALGFSPDGRRLVSAGRDGAAFVWPVPAGD